VIEAAPNFRPAWAQLLMAEANMASLPQNSNGASATMRALRQDIKRARHLFPDLAEATAAEYSATPNLSYLDGVALLDKAKSQDPDNPRVLIEHAIMMVTVGRIADQLDDLRRAAELDPLSPVTRAYLIRGLAFAGQVDAARSELARAKQLWPGTQTVKEAEGTIELRYGDFERGMRESGEYQTPEDSLYMAARKDPSASNVSRFVDLIMKNRNDSHRWTFHIQALGELNRVNEIYKLLATTPLETAPIGSSLVLFRPWLADARRDRRFMIVARRLGLVSYWQKSGHWPDFCSDPGLTYDCKKEAAKLVA
jgi:tetratricopeptide (TPR) repeat protein